MWRPTRATIYGVGLQRRSPTTLSDQPSTRLAARGDKRSADEIEEVHVRAPLNVPPVAKAPGGPRPEAPLEAMKVGPFDTTMVGPTDAAFHIPVRAAPAFIAEGVTDIVAIDAEAGA